MKLLKFKLGMMGAFRFGRTRSASSHLWALRCAHQDKDKSKIQLVLFPEINPINPVFMRMERTLNRIYI